MSNYRTPGVYVEEITSLPPSVAAVATAIPIFVGYTARQPADNVPTPINSYLEFRQIFGTGQDLTATEVRLAADNTVQDVTFNVTHYLQLALRLFYANGGGFCYVKSIGTPPGDGALAAVSDGDITTALFDELATYDDPTIVIFPDHPGSDSYDDILQHCATAKDRFAILDVASDDYNGSQLRNDVGTEGLSYGAAYTPWLRCVLPKGLAAHQFSATTFNLADGTSETGLTSGLISDVDSSVVDAATSSTAGEARDEAQANLSNNSTVFRNIMRGINAAELLLPPSGAVAGVYASVDAARGVWKAPANVSLRGVSAPDERFTRTELENLNVHTTGKSINAIRHFSGKGTLIFGARTLAGNDGEYRYVSVRRLMNMIEESCAKACEGFLFEPNTTNTWVRVRAMIENFLELIWRDGGLQGATAAEAFDVAIGLGETMTAQDVTDGRMIVSVSVAPVRPAEFIVLRFVQHLPTS